ncbi:MAG: hypothetical protein LBK59_00865, partial [Bifidobacteriaceae bacterium]|nr:hypothetical protein [Bifidobacteriaceae bacterium]
MGDLSDDTGRPGSTQDILRRAGTVPPLSGFPPLDGLTAAFETLRERHCDVIRARPVGASRRGEPIVMYSIGRGDASHLVVGGVHPNEPIGSWTALHLAEQLADDDALRRALNASWGIIPCIDPDGYR